MPHTEPIEDADFKQVLLCMKLHLVPHLIMFVTPGPKYLTNALGFNETFSQMRINANNIWMFFLKSTLVACILCRLFIVKTYEGTGRTCRLQPEPRKTKVRAPLQQGHITDNVKVRQIIKAS